MQTDIVLEICNPSVVMPTWYTEAAKWQDLNRRLGGNNQLTPLTVKALYVSGMIYGICESVGYLLRERDFARQVSYMPAYGIFVSAIELIGRCVKGETTVHRSSLRAGFKWLHTPIFSDYEQVTKDKSIILTSQKEYSIQELEYLRNYAAHGQATAQYYNIDYEIISLLFPVMKNGLKSYWMHLLSDGNVCDNLANANVIPLRGLPVLQFQRYLQINDGVDKTIENVFSKFNRMFQV